MRSENLQKKALLVYKNSTNFISKKETSIFNSANLIYSDLLSDQSFLIGLMESFGRMIKNIS